MPEFPPGEAAAARWLVDVDTLSTAHANTTWDTLTADSAAAFAAVKNSNGQPNAAIGWDVNLSAGTWTIELMVIKGADRGIYSVQLDGVEVGTVDGYAAATARSQRSAIAGVVVTWPGKHRVSLVMATKNPSSTAHYGSVQHLQLRRTA